MKGKLYLQPVKQVSFRSDQEMKLKYCHNLIAQTKPDKSRIMEYEPWEAMLMARLIDDLQYKVIEKGALFAQQYLLNKE